MQEVEIAPRDVFLHYITVPKGKTMLWWFSTKKKNISFGLYQRKGLTVSKGNVFIASPIDNRNLQSSSDSGHLSPISLKVQTPIRTPGVSSIKSRNSFETNDTDENEEFHGDDANDSSYVRIDSSAASAHSLSPVTNRGRKKSASAQIINDPDLKEILPIEHYNSSTTTIKGSYQVTEEGTYCLCFDNSFSRNTSKSLTFFVALKDGPEDEQVESQPEISGWLLKKKRKKMQGWAKRWVQIDDGILSYFQHPHGPCRGTIHIVLSTVSSNQQFRSIHLDSGTATYHMKALTNEQFDEWMTVIRKYVNISKERQLHDPDYTRTSSRQSGDFERRQSLYFKRQSLLEKRHSIKNDPQIFIRQNKLDEDIGKIYETFNGMDNGFRTLNELLDNLKSVTEIPPAPIQTKPHPTAEGKFRIKFSLPRGNTPPPESSTPPNALHMPLEQIYEKLCATIESIKKDKVKTFTLLQAEIEKWKGIDHAYSKLVTENAELRKALAEAGSFDESLENGNNIKDFEERLSNRSQSMSSANTIPDVFFDAEDIVLTGDPSTTDSDADIDVSDEGSEMDSSLTENSVVEKEEQEIVASPVGIESNDTKLFSTVRRRKILPSPICGDEVSLLSILKKNVGKDLATIAMPISLNEPINLLQKLAEDLEYSELLDKAASLDDSLMRLIYVSAFAVSGYASTFYRSSRKPFNPLHGETYELIRYKYISEKVSHYPPIMACYAESENWSFSQDSKVKSKFWGKSMELIPSGTVRLSIPKYNDQYTFSKPSTWMRNMISGTKYLEHAGTMKIQNQTTGEACEITFNQSGLFSSGPKSDIVGILYYKNGKKSGKLVGRWNEIVFHEIGPNQLNVIWKASPPIPDHEQYYGFTQFCVELNELTPDNLEYSPNTDTRFRPDQRLFEEGKLAEAEAEKIRIEQKQRDFRKELESKGEVWTPQWFKLENDEWVYKGGYWETREKKQFVKKIELW
ncbi:5112_t:CDS:2 [Diversispora eburnea]|uniref:5112_t:CDS:1 n=1 Tax=Diversispora eburnea TaxID=1213867 RepID=A0A9N8WHY7_9GLOM|nr:5112_t:CDS:2 [Diversispora eburnea]